MHDLGAYLLGGLPTTDAQDLRRHIDTCACCRTELKLLRPVADLLTTAEGPLTLSDRAEPAPDLASRLLARAEQEIDQQSQSGPTATAITSSPRRNRKRLLAVAGLAFALGAGSTVGVQQVAHRINKPDASPTGERIRFASIDVPARPSKASESKPPKAWAWIDQTGAGTYARLYTRDLEPNTVYRWWFERPDGSRVPLGSFRYPKEAQKDWLVCPGSTSVLRSEVVYIGATDERGVEVLREKLPPAPDIAKS
jgi:hypothetical protein